MPSPSQPTYSSNPKISDLLPYERNDLDYEVFEIDDPYYHNLNKIDLPSSGDSIRHIIPNKIARTLVECPVWAATGTTGCVQGTMMRQPHYIKMEGSETFQEMWAVKLDRNTSKSSETPQQAFLLIFPPVEPGDSGAWVVDSAGQLFGHIVAGDPMLGLAFIIPAYKVFDDIKRRFGSEALCCPSSSTMQPHNTLNNNVSIPAPSVGITQTWAPSRLCRWSDYQIVELTYLISSMVYLLLDISFHLPLEYYYIMFIGLGGVVTFSALQATAEIISIFPVSHNLPSTYYGIVSIGLGGVVSYSALQTAPEILAHPLLLPFANGSNMSIGLLQWVVLLMTCTRQIVLMRTYMSVQSGAEYPLATIIIQHSHELQIGDIWSFTGLLSALSTPSSALYVASRALYGMTYLRQHEEDARFWNSRHITSPNRTQVLLKRLLLLQLMFCNEHLRWQRIAHGGRHARTKMYLVCWGIARTPNAFVKALICTTSSEISLQSRNHFTAYLACLEISSNGFREYYSPHGRIIPSEEPLGMVLRSKEMLLREICSPEVRWPRGVFLSGDMVLTLAGRDRVILKPIILTAFRCLSLGLRLAHGRIDFPRVPARLLWADFGLAYDFGHHPDESKTRGKSRFTSPTLWCDEEPVFERLVLKLRCLLACLRWRIAWWTVFEGSRFGAIFVYDAHQLRRRRLNAPGRREDNSQCSESRERERQ